MSKTITIQLAGETKAGSAEVQPVRDSLAKTTDGRGDGGIKPVIPSFQKTIRSLLMPLKTFLPKARLGANRKGICPFQAEPIQC